MNFWQTFEGPIFALAPMEDVTDTVFREIVLSISSPKYLNVVFAEFTSVDGLCHNVGKDKVSHRLYISPSERELLKKNNVKIVAQIWGSDPEKFHQATRIIAQEYDFDGIDINMGCPVRKIVNQIACSELIKFPDLAKEIIIATKEATHLPVSVKTRTGIKTHNTEQWIGNLLEAKPTAITLHARTQKMMSAYPAEWEQVKIAVELRNQVSPEILIIGNGDILSIEDALLKIEQTSADGVMIGRGIFKNPFIFNLPREEISREVKLNLLLRHLDLFLDTWGNEKNFQIMKKFFKIYTSEFAGASDLRSKLMQTTSRYEVAFLISKHLKEQYNSD